MPTAFKADTIKINNIESSGSVGSAGNRWAVVKVSASLHLENTSSIRFNESTEISSSKAGVLNFYAVDTYFSSSVKALNLTGAIHSMPSGLAYLAAGSNITISTGANSQVTIAAGTLSTFDSQVPYVVLNATSSLTSERVLTASDGIVLVDGGAGAAVTLSANGTVARISGSRFVGSVTVTGTGSFESGISGSLTRLVDGTSYLVAGSNITVTSASAGITISAPSLTTFDNQVPYIVLNATSSLTSERVLTASDGIVLVDGGAGAAVTLSANGTVARISGSRFVGSVTVTGTGSFETGLTVGGTTAATVYFNTGTLPAGTKLGTDVLTFISGVAGSQGTTTQGTALFAGDIATSGTILYASATLANLNIPAAGFVGDGNSTFVGNLQFNGTASYWTNNPGGTQGVHVAYLSFPPEATITSVTVHLSRSATQVSQVALFRQNITSSQHALVASTTFTTKGEFINVSLNNLSHSVEPARSNTQYAYYLSVVQGITGQNDRHRLHGAKVSYYHNKLIF